MGFPRKDDVARIYRDKDKRSYFVILTDQRQCDGSWDAIANVYSGPKPSLIGTSVSPYYINQHWLKRCQFSEIPKEYQDAIRFYLRPGPGDEPEITPECIRGFWRVGEQPKQLTEV